ncbi:hypothetical protein A2U01_0065226, partial [Trifolium medium]|nr:hypothetical protein [Trifolium medium]
MRLHLCIINSDACNAFLLNASATTLALPG